MSQESRTYEVLIPIGTWKVGDIVYADSYGYVYIDIGVDTLTDEIITLPVIAGNAPKVFGLVRDKLYVRYLLNRIAYPGMRVRAGEFVVLPGDSVPKEVQEDYIVLTGDMRYVFNSPKKVTPEEVFAKKVPSDKLPSKEGPWA